MQLDAGMLRAGEAPPTQTVRAHAEVAAVLLRHDVGGDLARAHDRMHGAVDAHGLADPVVVLGPRVLPAGLELNERQLVRPVAVQLVGGHEHEHRLGAVPSAALEEIHRPHGVDVEIVERPARGEVVARLRGAVDDEVERALVAKGPRQRGAIADVHVVRAKAPGRAAQALEVPAGASVGTEEVGPHVVVDPHDGTGARVEVEDELGADESAGPGDEHLHARQM